MNTTLVRRRGVEAGSLRRAACPHHLRGDLARGQVVLEPHLAGRAERAAHRTSDLRRDADGDAVAVSHEDRLDDVLTAQPQEGLPRRAAIGRSLGHHVDAERKLFREAPSERGWHVAHLVVRAPRAHSCAHTCFARKAGSPHRTSRSASCSRVRS